MKKVDEAKFFDELNGYENEKSELVEKAKAQAEALNVSDEAKEKIIDVIVGDKAKVLDEKIAYLNGFVVEVEDEVEQEEVEVADPVVEEEPAKVVDEPKPATDPQPPFGFGNVRL
jgi:hypothetical protein